MVFVGKLWGPYDVTVIDPPVDGAVHLVKAEEGVHRFVVVSEPLIEVNRPAMVFPRAECGHQRVREPVDIGVVARFKGHLME